MCSCSMISGPNIASSTGSGFVSEWSDPFITSLEQNIQHALMLHSCKRIPQACSIHRGLGEHCGWRFLLFQPLTTCWSCSAISSRNQSSSLLQSRSSCKPTPNSCWTWINPANSRMTPISLLLRQPHQLNTLPLHRPMFPRQASAVRAWCACVQHHPGVSKGSSERWRHYAASGQYSAAVTDF